MLSSPDDKWFARNLDTHGDALAIVSGTGEPVSYRALAERADASAAGLVGASLAAIEFVSTLDAVSAYLGALRMGVPVILLAPGALEADDRIVRQFRPDALFRGGWRRQAVDIKGAAPHPDLAILLPTSGSTGDPKLVRLSRGNLVANAEAIVQYLGLKPSDRAITSLPLSYSFGLSILHSHLSAGASIALTSESVATEEFWRVFREAGCTVFAGVPHSYKLLERSDFFARELPTLRILQQAGGRMDPDAVLRWSQWAAGGGRRFFVMYGQTEATARMAYLSPEQAAAHPDCIGLPIPGGAFTIERDDGSPIDGAGEAGELVYRGPNVMMGYAHCREDIAQAGGPPVLPTGDIAERTPGGLFRIVGRASRFVKHFGLRIQLDDIERMLASEGLDAAVAGDDDRIVIAVERGVAAAPLRQRLAERYKLPEASFELLHGIGIPRRESGKPDYAAILETARSMHGKGSADSVTGLHRLYTAIARGRKISRRESFSSLGGDSLSYVHATLEIEGLLGYVPDGWENISLAELESLSADGAKPRPGTQSMVKLDSEILLRACAITAIVMLHTHLTKFAGGAELLIFLAGYNLVRFQRERLFSSRALEIVRNFFLNFMVPYLGLMLIYFGLKGELDIASLLLVSNYIGRFRTVLEPYWFLEALFQCLLLTAMFFWLPPIRRAAKSRPIALLAALFLAAATARIIALGVEPASLRSRTLASILYLFAGGMLFAGSRNRLFRLGISCAVITLSVATWGFWDTHPWWLIVALAALIFVPRVPAPRPFRYVVENLAAASFYIYMVHAMVIWILVSFMGAYDGILPATVSLLAGWATWRLHRDAMQGQLGKRIRPAGVIELNKRAERISKSPPF